MSLIFNLLKNMEFPCKTLTDFMQFQENLKSDARFRQDFVRYFSINILILHLQIVYLILKILSYCVFTF